MQVESSIFCLFYFCWLLVATCSGHRHFVGTEIHILRSYPSPEIIVCETFTGAPVCRASLPSISCVQSMVNTPENDIAKTNAYPDVERCCAGADVTNEVELESFDFVLGLL